jgi:hypothetical protein
MKGDIRISVSFHSRREGGGKQSKTYINDTMENRSLVSEALATLCKFKEVLRSTGDILFRGDTKEQ